MDPLELPSNWRMISVWKHSVSQQMINKSLRITVWSLAPSNTQAILITSCIRKYCRYSDGKRPSLRCSSIVNPTSRMYSIETAVEEMQDHSTMRPYLNLHSLLMESKKKRKCSSMGRYLNLRMSLNTTNLVLGAIQIQEDRERWERQ